MNKLIKITYHKYSFNQVSQAHTDSKKAVLEAVDLLKGYVVDIDQVVYRAGSNKPITWATYTTIVSFSLDNAEALNIFDAFKVKVVQDFVPDLGSKTFIMNLFDSYRNAFSSRCLIS